MGFTEQDEVRVYGGRIGTIEKVVYVVEDGKETDDVHYYEMEIDGVGGYIVYPGEIEEY